jgi:hypothetical protein
LRLQPKARHLGRAHYVLRWTVVPYGELGELRIPTTCLDMRGNQVIRVVADRQGRELMEVGKEAGAEVVCGTSLKAALDQDWDQLGQREEALSLVLKVLQVVETWVQTLQRDEVELARGILEIARQVEAQDVQADSQGKVSLIKGVAKDRRKSHEDAEMRHGRKSRSVRVDGYKRHVLHESSHGSHPSSGDHAS